VWWRSEHLRFRRATDFNSIISGCLCRYLCEPLRLELQVIPIHLFDSFFLQELLRDLSPYWNSCFGVWAHFVPQLSAWSIGRTEIRNFSSALLLLGKASCLNLKWRRDGTIIDWYIGLQAIHSPCGFRPMLIGIMFRRFYELFGQMIRKLTNAVNPNQIRTKLRFKDAPPMSWILLPGSLSPDGFR